MTEISLRTLAQNVLAKQRDKAWDKVGTSSANLSQAGFEAGTRKSEENQGDNPLVPLSQPLGVGQWDKTQNSGTELGTSLGQTGIPAPYDRAVTALRERCPAHVEPRRWKQCVADSDSFIAQWGEQAAALGWTAKDLFGLFPVPADPAPSFDRLSRYDHTALCWLLNGCRVVALSSGTAAIEHNTGGITKYRKDHKPALGPVGDSLDDFDRSEKCEN